jgi:hypothetical protein
MSEQLVGVAAAGVGQHDPDEQTHALTRLPSRDIDTRRSATTWSSRGLSSGK